MGNIPPVAPGQPATADQYNALQSALNPLVENNYTSWKLITNVNTPIPAKSGIPAGIVIDEINGVVYLYDYANFIVWSMNVDGSNMTQLIGGGVLFSYIFFGIQFNNYYPGNGLPFTLTGKYMLVQTIGAGTGAANNSFAVLSKGTVLQTFDVSSYFFNSSTSGSNFTTAISPTGRYIVALGQNPTTNALTVLVYEGQP